MHPSRLIDLAHYSRTAGRNFSDRIAAYAHFVVEGQAAGYNPSPFLYTRWYQWQNDISKYRSVLDHFVHCARDGLIDPCPFIDSVLFLRAHPEYNSILEVYLALIEGREMSIEPSLASNLSALNAARERVHGQIRAEILRDDGGHRRRLVWVQSGKSFQPANWFRADHPRSWDLMCNWYSLAGMDLRFGEVHVRQSGTKATGMHHILRQYPALLQRYDQVLFIDDDLIFEHSDLDVVFDIAQQSELDMFQPSVAPGSQCVWPDLFHVQGSTSRRLTGVEIMMFGFTRRALELCAPLFERSVSGFGLDFRCSEAVLTRGWHCGVIDAVCTQHLEVIDEKGGAYYEFMRTLGINQKLELFEAIIELHKMPTFANLILDSQN